MICFFSGKIVLESNITSVLLYVSNFSGHSCLDSCCILLYFFTLQVSLTLSPKLKPLFIALTLRGSFPLLEGTICCSVFILSTTVTSALAKVCFLIITGARRPLDVLQCVGSVLWTPCVLDGGGVVGLALVSRWCCGEWQCSRAKLCTFLPGVGTAG